MNGLKDFDLTSYIERVKAGEDVRTIEDEIFPFLCEKRHYKKECDPAYCIFRYMGACDWIKAIKILRKAAET